MSLPFALGATDFGRHVPYFRSPPEAAADLCESIRAAGSRLRVGYVWSGNPAHKRDGFRSCPVERFRELATEVDAAFFSLDKGAPDPSAPGIQCGHRLSDFADTAAVLSELDLVITVDTAVAHLAGALGKRVWLLVSTVADWRWQTERSDSPWYPTMRLFRQKRRGEWGDVFDRVRKELGRETGTD